MSRTSTKSATRSAKTAAGTRKKSVKSVKSARKSAKKPSATASRRSTAAKVSRATPSRARKAVAAAPAATATRVAEMQMQMIRTVSPPVQPAAPQVVVHPHKYRVGETVYYTSPSFGRAAATGSYTVVKLLPSDGEDYQYRIKSSGEAFERVAKESQLDRV